MDVSESSFSTSTPPSSNQSSRKRKYNSTDSTPIKLTAKRAFKLADQPFTGVNVEKKQITVFVPVSEYNNWKRFLMKLMGEMIGYYHPQFNGVMLAFDKPVKVVSTSVIGVNCPAVMPMHVETSFVVYSPEVGDMLGGEVVDENGKVRILGMFDGRVKYAGDKEESKLKFEIGKKIRFRVDEITNDGSGLFVTGTAAKDKKECRRFLENKERQKVMKQEAMECDL